ncbi:uncharacterized protein [Lolium perenne]|uniref:uncharacterized protein isoform X1 n=1 Tax=Lolium perenne TaxID=4522 RepID=UPI003A9988BE
MMHFFIYQDHTLVQSYVNHLWVQIGVYKAPQCEVIDWRLNMACNDGSGLGRSMYMQEVEALLVIKHQKGQTQGARCHVWWPSTKSKLHMLLMVGAIWQPTSSLISLLRPSLSSISQYVPSYNVIMQMPIHFSVHIALRRSA